MEHKDYVKLAKYIERHVDRSAFSPHLFGAVMVGNMSSHAQRKFAQAVLQAISTWGDLTMLRDDDEVWMMMFGQQINKVSKVVDLR